jgi:molybdate transport system substrate-binding protein
MRMRKLAAAWLGAALAIGLAGGAQAAELKVLSSNAIKTVLEELVPQFEKSSEHKVALTLGTAAELKVAIEKGAPFDVAIGTAAGIDDLAKQGKVDADTKAALARSGVGVAVKKGAPKPDISTTEGFKKALLDAKSIAFVEQGNSGIYLKTLFVRLGIADQIKDKLKPLPASNPAAHAVANGEAEIGMTQISEILPFAGADLVGPLPADIQLYTSFAGANSAATKQPDAGKAFFKFLVTPDTAKVMKAKGLEPAS